ncbi:MBL fold metallo-hydrolase [bacterium]|nr:MBL fold metallo-hydrolase [bacterium]
MQLGDWTFRLLDDGQIRFDGGAMFGIVPKPLWEKQIGADDRNRIPIGLRCLLAEGGGRRVLVDTGVGDRWDAKQRAIYGMDRRAGELLNQLDEAGLARGSITDVVLTHLHFDHAGGACLDADGLVPTFPEATYWLQKQQWEWAQHPSDRDRASFRAEDFAPLEESGRLELVDGATEILPGLRVGPVSGHTPGQQVPEFHTDDGTLVFMADFIPTVAHIHLPWIAGFDLNPLLTLSEKREFLSRAAADDYILVFQHETVHDACRVEFSDGRFRSREVFAI